MKRDLYTAIMRGKNILDEKGPQDWRERLREALPDLEGASWFSLLPLIYYGQRDIARAVHTLGLVPQDYSAAGVDDDEPERIAALNSHGFWPINAEGQYIWHPDELGQAWTQLIDKDTAKLEDTP